MKHSAAVIGTKKKELPIPIYRAGSPQGSDVWLGVCILVPRNPVPHPPCARGMHKVEVKANQVIFMDASRNQLLLPAAFQRVQPKPPRSSEVPGSSSNSEIQKSSSQPGVHSGCSPWLSSPLCCAPKSLQFPLSPSLLYLPRSKLPYFLNSPYKRSIVCMRPHPAFIYIFSHSGI